MIRTEVAALIAACSLLSCSKKADPGEGAASSAASAKAAAPTASLAAAPPTPAAAPAAEGGGAPKHAVKGEGIEITEMSDGTVVLKTSATWGESLDTTYENCDYFRRAVPVLARQVAPERAKLLSQACAAAPK